jgi:catechol 2,3-dioxygenase-like lactoylglutathione lyase family enzyme
MKAVRTEHILLRVCDIDTVTAFYVKYFGARVGALCLGSAVDQGRPN